MTITQFLGLFHPIKETMKGWDVCCPAHDDQRPSLGVMEGEGGRIVLNCLAHCATKTICERLGISLSDLFPDRPLTGHARPLTLPPVKRSPRKLAFAFDLHAHDLSAQAGKILEASKHCHDCETWTNDEMEWALKAVNRAYVYQTRALFCEEYADYVREKEYELKRPLPC